MQPANFAYWDTVSEFHPNEIGWLLCDLEPPRKHRSAAPPPALPQMGNRMLKDMAAAIRAGTLPRITYYPREMLRAWVENYSDYRPLFLFPDMREKKRNSESQLKRAYNNLLLIIAGMALGKYKKDLKTMDDRQIKAFARLISSHIELLPAKFGDDSIESRLKEAKELLETRIDDEKQS